jgi:hypothetical protein
MAESGKPAGSAMRFFRCRGHMGECSTGIRQLISRSIRTLLALHPKSQFTKHYFGRRTAGGTLMLELIETDGFLQ